MTLPIILLLAIVQGLTEFLPVSSSAHLILIEKLFDVTGDGGNMVIIAVHFGSLFAVMLYFRNEVARMFSGVWDILRLRWKTSDAGLVLKLAFATIPVVVVGFLLTRTSWYNVLMHNGVVIACAMMFFGVVLYWADVSSPETRDFDDFNYRDALIMGLWQAIALIPGTSRSGATVTASRFLGFNRTDGATLSMLMSIPTILAAVILTSVDIVKAGEIGTFGKTAIIATGASFIAAYVSLYLLMKFLKTVNYTPYVIYRFALGIILLFVFLT